MKQGKLSYAIVAIAFLSSTAAFAYSPEPQTARPVTTNCTPPTINTFTIYAQQNSDYWSTAETCHRWLFQNPGVWLSTYDLATLGTHGTNEIILGNPGLQTTVAQIASSHHMSTLDLGDEGYLLHSEPVPGGCGTWRIIIIANTTAGIMRGLATLADAVKAPDNPNMTVPAVIIRDYPDSPHRAYQYKLPNFYSNAVAWLNDQFNILDQIAKIKVNEVHFVTSIASELQQQVEGAIKAYYVKLVFDRCRQLGMEPVLDLSCNQVPDQDSHPMWREGKFIDGELFNAVYNQDLENTVGPFPNYTENLDWHGPIGTNGLPDQWVVDGSNNWTFTDGRLKVSSPSGSLKTEISIHAGDYYVLLLRFHHITFDIPTNTRPYIHLADRTDPNVWNKVFYLSNTGSDPTSYIYECPFSAPALTNGKVWLSISTKDVTGVNIEIESISIDRRNAGFVNLMQDSQAEHPLKVEIYAQDGTHYVGGSDYEIRQTNTAAWDWRMPSIGPHFAIRWKRNTTTAPVRVYYTLGVPSSNPGMNINATTFCFSNPELFGEQGYTKVLRDVFYYGLSPKYIGIDLDELRGINRCGRCVKSVNNPPGVIANDGRWGEDTNSSYVVNFVNTIRGILNTLPEPAPQTQLMAYGDMFNPEHNGKDVKDQLNNWLGRQGKTSGALDQLTGDLDLYLWHNLASIAARNLSPSWPGRENPTVNVNVLASVLTGEDPLEWVKQPTWYEPDALGFFAYKYEPVPPTLGDALLMNFAWKRHAHPEASLQAFLPDETYQTDDVADHPIYITPGQSLRFYPFGGIENRDGGCSGAGIDAFLDWGDGGTYSLTTQQLNRDHFDHTFSQPGAYTVSLMLSPNPYPPPPNCVVDNPAPVVTGAPVHVYVSDNGITNVSATGVNSACPVGYRMHVTWDTSSPANGSEVVELTSPSGAQYSWSGTSNSRNHDHYVLCTCELGVWQVHVSSHVGTVQLNAYIPKTVTKYFAPCDGMVLSAEPMRRLTVAPNPMRGFAQINFDMPQSGSVRVSIYDISGRLVKTVMDESVAAGNQTVQWTGLSDSGQRTPNGVYFVRIKRDHSAESIKFMKIGG